MKFIKVTVVILTFFVAACSSDSGGGNGNGNTPDYPVKNTKAYNGGPAALFGDSIARGEGASSDLKSLVGCMTTISSSVINLAKDGATTKDSMPILQFALDDKPSIVLVSLGGNDAIVDAFTGELPEQETLDNIRKIFKSFTDAGSLVIHLGLNPPENPTFPVDTSRLQKIKSIAVEEGVIFLDNSMEGMWGNSEYMSDEVHPNDKGYSLLCDRVKGALAPHLK